MNLFQKGLLAFAVVILVAIATVALLAGYHTEAEFRRYAMLYSGRTQRVAEALVAYYRDQGSWDGLASELPRLTTIGGRGRPAGVTDQPQDTDYWVANAERQVVATTADASIDRLSNDQLDAALPLTVGEETVGYLAIDTPQGSHAALDEPAAAFVSQLRYALLLGGAVALAVALPVAGFLTRSIVSPVRNLTHTAETISEGRFDVRAEVGGQDEIARLATTFNEMARSLQRAEDLRQAQTADIAHELRNPLAVLQSSLEALADGIYAPTPENLDPALAQVQTLNRLVEDLRTLALADAGQLRLDLQPVDLNALVARVAESYRESLQAQGIMLRLALDPDVAPVTADYARLTQVLNNILSNAIRYVTPGCEVALSTRPDGDGTVVYIVDNGPGVPDDQLSRLFDRFWRADPSRNRDTGGSGLGLAIVHQIIEAHAGKIWAERTPGGGLTLAFRLPTS